MVCDRCGNKLAPNTTVCKLCGYDNKETDAEKVIDVEVQQENNTTNKPKKEVDPKITIDKSNFTFDKITLYFSLFLMIIPIIAIGLIYYFMQFNTILVIASIVSLVIQIIANYMFVSINKNEKLEKTIVKSMVILSFFILTFATTMVIAAYALKQPEIIVEYSSIFITCIAVSITLLLSNLSMKLLRKYS